MTVPENWNIHTSVSVIACYLYGIENCPDFQYQITECLTLIFNMFAIRSNKCALQMQSYKEFAKDSQTMTMFFTRCH